MAKRRRSPRVVWLPPDLNNRAGLAPGVATSTGDSAHFFGALTGPPLGSPTSTILIPLVRDENSGSNAVSATATLADIESSSYRLRRLVGKIVIIIGQNVAAAAEDPTLYQVTAGFIVLKTGNAGTAPTLAPEDYSPEIIANADAPWIWRRSWVLCDQEGAAVTGNNTRAPRSNIEGYGGGNADASHVDQKTARTITHDERLFFVATCRGLDGNPQAANPGLALVVGDIRVLASMRSSVGNRGNSSR